MNNFIHKTNQYLLERFPIIWNTRLLWMVAIAVIAHILFFFYGYLSLINPESLQSYSAEDVFFTEGGIFLSIIMSVLMIVFWLIMMFKNNAFKSFYPTRAWDLVKQFGCYFLIIFLSISFYFSFQTGLTTYIGQTYDDERFENDIQTVNSASLFFSHNIQDYKLNNKLYPIKFQELYCETYDSNIFMDSPYLESTFDNQYQYYTLKTLTRDINTEYIDSIYDASVFNESAGKDLKRYYFKDEAIDLSDEIETVQPSYYHYSKVYYQRGISNYLGYSNYDSDMNYNEYGYGKNKPQISEFKAKLVQQHYELLKRGDTDEIKELLGSFLQLARDYRIKHNITDDQWFDAIYDSQNFEVKTLINSRKTDYDYGRIYDENENLTPLQEYAEKINSNYYINTEDLKQALDNIHDIKQSNYFETGIHVILWLAFFIALMVFTFRLTGLKPVLFSIIAAGLLGILISLISIFAFTTMTGSSYDGYFVSYLVLAIGTIILLGTILWMPHMNKLVSAIFLNLTAVGILPYILLILAIITMHQEDACRDRYPIYQERKENCFILLESIGAYWTSALFIALAFFSIWWISNRALKWKSLPEG